MKNRLKKAVFMLDYVIFLFVYSYIYTQHEVSIILTNK